MDSKGKVAICIPTYQKVDYIKRLLDSIRIQTYKEFIVVISDDTEDSSIEEMIIDYQDIKIDYNRNTQKLGATYNTNNAINIAQKYNPEFIKIMHQDDYFSECDSLFKMVKVIKNNPDVDLVFVASIDQLPNRSYERLLTEQQWQELKNDYRNLYIFNYIGGPSTTIVRNNGILMDSNLVWFVDVEWYIQLLSKNEKIIYMREPLIVMNGLGNQVTDSCKHNPKLWIDEVIYIYNKYSFLREEKYKDYLIETLERQWQRLNIIEKCKGEKIYIYGAGVLGQDCAIFLKKHSIDFEGYIVSEGQKCKDEVMGYRVSTLGEIIKRGLNCINIILALNKKNKEEVIDILKEHNVDYISYV